VVAAALALRDPRRSDSITVPLSNMTNIKTDMTMVTMDMEMEMDMTRDMTGSTTMRTIRPREDRRIKIITTRDRMGRCEAGEASDEEAPCRVEEEAAL
jgi:CheY-like chemotaxis protein